MPIDGNAVVEDVRAVQDADGELQPAASDAEEEVTGTKTLGANGSHTVTADDIAPPGRFSSIRLLVAFQSGSGSVTIHWLDEAGTELDTTGPSDSANFTSDDQNKIDGEVVPVTRNFEVTIKDTSAVGQDVTYAIRVI